MITGYTSLSIHKINRLVNLLCSALDKNEYNHITATYFLLAERRLKITRQEQAPLKRPVSTVSNKNNRLVLKKPSSDVIDGSTEINSSNFLALPPPASHNKSKTGNADGAVTTVSLFKIQ